MSKPVVRKAKIIFDEPASSDAFDGGGHQRSAEALADAVEQLIFKNGAIGLEGKWGSGKSTVIRLAEDVLAKRNNCLCKYHVFNFDLWAHQTDDFRRSFLEAFVNWIEAEKLLEKSETETAKDAIRDRVKVVRSDNFKQYHFFGILFILSAPLLPIAYSWLSPVAFKTDAHLSADGVMWQTYSKFFLIAMYLVFTVSLLTKAIKASRKGLKVTTSKGLLQLTSQAISIFSKDVEKETTTQNIRETDPTTLEFHQVFRRLLSSIQRDGKRIIFVLDNIDRLPKASVQPAWSEVRSVFSNASIDLALKEAYVTAVIPYDKDFIDDVFEVKKSTSSNVPNLNAEIEGDIISKTFNRILRVSPPVATDWRAFLEKLLVTAFSSALDEQTAFRLFNLLKHDFRQKDIHPTPRRIIAYVNEVSALWSQWGDVISVEAIALFVLYRAKVEGHPVAIQKIETVDKRYERIAGVTDWQRDFAALSFNVQPALAYQVLLQEPTAKALTEEDADDLLDLSKSKGFEVILQDVLEENIGNWIGDDSSIIANVANNIEALGLTGELASSVWRTMATSVSQLSEIDIDDKNTLKGFLSIVRGQKSGAVLKVADSIRAMLDKQIVALGDDAVNKTTEWLNAVVQLSNTIGDVSDKKSKDNFIKMTSIPKTKNARGFYIWTALACAERGDINLKDFKTSVIKSEAVEAYATLIQESPRDFLTGLNQVSHLFDDVIRTQYLENIGTKLQKSVQENSEDTVALIEAYAQLYVANAAAPISHLKKIATDGTLAWQGYQLSLKEQQEALPNIFALSVAALGGTYKSTIPDNHPAFGNITAAKQWYSETINDHSFDAEDLSIIAKFVSASRGFSAWSTHAIEDTSNESFFIEVVKKVIEQGKLGALHVKKAVIDYPALKGVIGDDLASSFLRIYAGWSPSFEKEFSDKNALNIPNEFIVDANKLDIPELNIILGLIDKYLKGLSKEDWDEVLATGDDRFRLLVCRRETSDLTLSVETYRPALMAHALKVLEEGAQPSRPSEEWAKALMALKTASRKKLAEDLFNKLTNATVTVAGVEKLIEFYLDIANQIPYEEAPDKALDKIFSKLVYSTMDTARKFLKDNATVLKKCIKAASASSKEGFEEAIESVEEGNDSELEEWAQELRTLCGIKKKIKPTQEPAKDENLDSDDTAKG